MGEYDDNVVRDDSAEYAAKERAAAQGGMFGGQFYCGSASISPEEQAKQDAWRKHYEAQELRKAALGSAIGYAAGRSRSADDVVRDATAFLDFLTVPTPFSA